VSHVKPRSYSSPLRQRQAAENRRAILRSAHELFLRQGYGGTTVDQIAAMAGVSKPTVFTSIGNKAEVFRLVRDIAIAGDDDPAPVAQRPSVGRVRSAEDLNAAVSAIASHIAAISRRAAGIQEVLRGAAATGDPAMRELWVTSEEQRLRGAQLFVELLTGHARPTVRRQWAVDILWLLMATDNYHRLTVERGWTDNHFRRWLKGAILTQLYGEPGAS
jgi:AcrR family transcriptional regulator